MSQPGDPATTETRPPFQVELRDGAGAAAVDAAATAAWARRIDTLAAGSAPWMSLETAAVPAEVLARVPARPTLVVGFGGSALGARAALEVARRSPEGAKAHEVRVLDTVDPTTVREDLDWARAVGAAVHVISKSGRTDEVRALLELVLAEGLGPHVLISDPGERPFDVRVREAGLTPLRLEMPADVGGRYSVFTAVGQAPLAAAGLPSDALLRGAKAAAGGWRQGGASVEPFARLLAHRATFPAAAHVVWCYSDGLLPWAAWLQQLECESLGRATDDGGVGELVTVLRGPADQHSVAQLLLDGPRDKRVTFVDYADDGVDARAPAQLRALGHLRRVERDATFEAMRVPCARLLLPDRSLESLGSLMLHGLAWTVLMASHMGIDPYGQPAVEDIKRRVKAAYAT